MENNLSTTDTISQCAELLIELGLTLGFAESATCGHISSAFSLADNAGKFLKGGIACYDANLKESLLKVDEKLIDKYTPESAEVTKAIATGIAPLLQANICIGCTGLTCPGGSENSEKPVGTMFLHGLHGNETIFTDRSVFTGSQQQIIEKATNRAARLLLYYLSHQLELKKENARKENSTTNGVDERSVSWP